MRIKSKFISIKNKKNMIRKTSDNCSDPKKIGSCENYSPYYYYNTKTRKCERFMYSGCGGNGNKYIMLSECIVQCELKSKAK
ncbi:kunitz-like toxin PcKuz3 isoform X2 [Hypanus sabinus]|uniref:kunitz-like toxin PcKuz3 isoform X2 n=1 Tax=Hypanus sabinus TaxID=79690 RepID=UPI0028C47A07|nr:kunitz-like toxin PcKuz3 isoform X2 [Hypanus sabinus]